MSRLRALAAECLRVSIVSKAKDLRSFDAGLAELIAQLVSHAEDAVEKERAEMELEDQSKGVGV